MLLKFTQSNCLSNNKKRILIFDSNCLSNNNNNKKNH